MVHRGKYSRISWSRGTQRQMFKNVLVLWYAEANQEHDCQKMSNKISHVFDWKYKLVSWYKLVSCHTLVWRNIAWTNGITKSVSNFAKSFAKAIERHIGYDGFLKMLTVSSKPVYPAKGFQCLGGLCRKDNSSQSSSGRLQIISRCHDGYEIFKTVPHPGLGIKTKFPFGCDELLRSNE